MQTMAASSTPSLSSSSSSSSLAALELHVEKRPSGGSRSCCFRPFCKPRNCGYLSLQLIRRPRSEEVAASSIATTAATSALRGRGRCAGLPVSHLGACCCGRHHQSPAAEIVTRRGRESISPEAMDYLVTESIGEIVRHVGKAPLLVYINGSYDASSGRLRLETEAASPERWSHVKKKWEEEENRKPDVVILVEELDRIAVDKTAGADAQLTPTSTSTSPSTAAATAKTWGLVVQGRGGSCAAACYILSTTRIRSSAGFCTHFSLVRGYLGEPLDVQIKKAWLQQGIRS